QVVEIARVALLLIVGIPLMFWQNVTMTLISLTLFPVLIIFVYVHYLRIRKLFEAVDEADGRLNTALQENLTGIRVARAFGR
ncbi:ABC transporter transmembrane domain-containing protein, partial [Escherichia coli]|uniref:ABC transporter transmembrane domain-containing protein n=1 Tax=Escherichia coli TaxID=562 RepID=UPI0039E16EE8